MRTYLPGVGVISIALVAMLSGAYPVAALSLKECSAKYKAAESAGTLGGMNWQQFRQANCAKPSLALSPGATFPEGVSPKYAKESAGKARMHTCLDQYRSNKATNNNGGLRWIAKGGGYYSECNKRLKV